MPRILKHGDYDRGVIDGRRMERAISAKNWHSRQKVARNEESDTQMSEHPEDICVCGDPRRNHKDGNGQCVFNEPENVGHCGAPNCFSFELAYAHDDPAAKQNIQSATEVRPLPDFLD